MEQVTKRHRHTNKHYVSGVSASSSLSITNATRIVAGSSKDFPADVIFNILLRLPMKSLLCCRCVCETWRNIIDSPYFTNMHFTSGRANINNEEPQLMLVCHAIQKQDKMRLFTLMDAGVNKLLRSSEFPIVEIANSYDYFAEPLCYGLFCFRKFGDKGGQVFLLNPVRGEVLMLPPVTVTPHSDFYGVGFDSTTETYKVVRIFSRKSDFDLQQHDLATEVYTLGTRSWREIPSPTVPPCYVSGRAVSAYGDVHWLGRRWFHDGSDEVMMIMSFDTKKEEFKLTPHPNLPTKFKYFHLFDFRGHLAMVDNSSRTHLEVWVLKDYDKKEWAMEHRISTAKLLLGRQILDIRIERNVTAIGGWEHGLLFQTGHNDLVCYNPKTDSLNFMFVQPDVPSFHKRIIGYNGSLVSLKNSGNMVAREAGKRNYFDLKN